ncbi:MAG: hypothetical protein HY553_03965 [Elusimicrobia bacterium]|nr:hypothetical protein [Elusimicrobiota bacterium]
MRGLLGPVDHKLPHFWLRRPHRYLAGYHFTLNGTEPVLLASTNVDFHRSRSFFTNPRIGGYRTEIAPGLLVVSLARSIEEERLVEEWEIDNHGPSPARFTFMLAFQASFEDLYQVRGFHGPSARIVFGD